jgi:hypothetical protein
MIDLLKILSIPFFGLIVLIFLLTLVNYYNPNGRALTYGDGIPECSDEGSV